MSKILKPVIEEVKYESGSLDTLQETLKISFRDENKMLLFEYPTNYTDYPNAMLKSVIKSKDKTFEFLFDHACIFTGNEIQTTKETPVEALYASVARHIVKPKDITITHFEPLTEYDRPLIEYLLNSGLYDKAIFSRSNGTIDTSAFDFATVANWYNMIKIYCDLIKTQLPSNEKILSILYYVATKKIYRDKFDKIVTADKSENYLTHLIKAVIRET